MLTSLFDRWHPHRKTRLVLPYDADIVRHYIPVQTADGDLAESRALGVDGVLGSGVGVDAADPTWKPWPRALTFGGDDRVEIADAPISLAAPFTVMAAVKIHDGSDLFETRSLAAVTNLAAEYGVQIDPGCNLQYTLPATFDPNNWTISNWFLPDFANTDAFGHVLIEIAKDANNRIVLQKRGDTFGYQFYIVAGGVTSAVYVTKAFPAGTPTFAGARLCGGTLYGYADTDADGSLTDDVQQQAGIPALAAGTYIAYIGTDSAAAYALEGASNLLITDNGGSANPITDRFNAGAGMALAGDDGWLARHGRNLVLHVGGNAGGTAIQADTYSGATDMLAGTATGRVDLPATTGYVRTANTAEFDAATKVSMMWECEVDAVGAAQTLFASDGVAGPAHADCSLGAVLDAGTSVYAYFDGSGKYERQLFGTAHVAGDRFMLGMAVDLGLATTARVKWYESRYDPITKHYGTWAELTGAKSEGGAVPAAITAEAGLHQLGGGTWDGKIDCFRWKVGEAHDFTTLKSLPHEPDPSKWAHSYPFDGDANDQIGTLNGTVTGGSYVDDGRHGPGSMERWVKQGQYAFVAATDKIVTADPGAGADGLAQATWDLYWTATATATGRIFRRADGADNQFTIVETATGLRMYVADAGADAANYVDFPISGYAARKTYKGTVVYDGGLAAGLRVALYAKELDLESGRYLAQTTPTPAVTGTIATTLRASALGYTFGSDSAGGGPGAGNVGLLLDGVRIWYGVALTSGEADAEYVSEAPAKAGCSHRWDFTGNATDSIAALNGTVTGALQWYDGRIPEGLTLSSVERIGRGRYLARKTISRAGPGRYYDGVDYLTRTAPAGHLRDAHYWTANDGVTYRTTLLGRAYTNLNTSDNLAAWSDSGTPVVTAGISDPLGGTGAYKVADDDGAAQEMKIASVTFTGDGTKAFVAVVREATMPSAGVQQFRIYSNTAGTARLDLTITSWVAGNPQVTMVTGTLLGKRYVGNGYWAIYAQALGVVAADANRFHISPAITAAQTGSIDVYRVNAFNDVIPPQDILDASEVRAADSFTDAYTALPQAATYLYEGIVADLPNQGTVRTFLNLGNGTGAEAAIRLYYEAASARLVIAYHNGVSEVTGYWTVALAMSDRISVRWHQAASGAIDAVGLKVNAVAEDTTLDGAFGGTLALPAAWNAAQVVYSGANATANSAATKFVTASGAEKTLAQLQALLETDASCLYLYVPGQYTDRGTYSLWMQNTGATSWTYKNATTTTGLWGFTRTRVRELVAHASAYFEVGGWTAIPAVAPGTSLGIVAIGARETAGGTRYIYTMASDSGFGYYDDQTWYQLPLATPSTAHRGVPTRVVWSTSIPGAIKPYMYLALTEAETFKAGVRNDAGTLFESGENTAPGIGYRTVAMTWDLTTLRLYVDGVVEATTSTPTGTTAALTAQTLGAIRLAITGHGHDDDIGDVIEWSRALAAGDIVNAHAQLKRLYPALV